MLEKEKISQKVVRKSQRTAHRGHTKSASSREVLPVEREPKGERELGTTARSRRKHFHVESLAVGSIFLEILENFYLSSYYLSLVGLNMHNIDVVNVS